MNISHKQIVPAALIAGAMLLLALVILLKPLHFAYGDVTTHEPTPVGDFQTYTFFATSTNQVFFATTTTATSTNINSWTNSKGEIDKGFFNVKGAKDVIFYFSRGDTSGNGNAGNTQFKVQVSPDGTNWFDYQELGLIQQSGGADVFFARTGTSTITAATSTVMAAMEDLDFYAVRCIAVKTTDGEASCKATAQF